MQRQMRIDPYQEKPCYPRRDFMSKAVAAIAIPLLSSAAGAAHGREPAPAQKASLAFRAEGKEFHFDTGSLRGTLRPEGKSLGLTSVVDSATGSTLSGAYGLFSHYRLLDVAARYGHAGWDWASSADVLPDGAVESVWSADVDHPFEMRVVYRWKAPNILDVTTSILPQKNLLGFEVFLASYFDGFAGSFVYVKACPETGDKAGLLEAKRSSGLWQMFPRDDQAVEIAQDGRWQRPPNPVEWKIMPSLAGPLAVRRDGKTGLAGMVTAPPADCFAVSSPFSGEDHRSAYLSLFGRDLNAGQKAVARSRLILARGIGSGSNRDVSGLPEGTLKSGEGNRCRGWTRVSRRTRSFPGGVWRAHHPQALHAMGTRRSLVVSSFPGGAWERGNCPLRPRTVMKLSTSQVPLLPRPLGAGGLWPHSNRRFVFLPRPTAGGAAEGAAGATLSSCGSSCPF